METSAQITDYCNKVCEQIRWKNAKKYVYSEIEQHLIDQRDSYLTDGQEESSATQQAILQMGDPVMIGEELDKTHKPKPQTFMITLTVIFMLVGISVDYFIVTSVDFLNHFNILPYVIGFGIFFLCYSFDFTVLAKRPKMIYVITLISSIIALTLSSNDNGRNVFLPFNFPLLYLSLVFPLAFALFVYSLRDKGKIGIFLSGIAYLPFAIILVLVPTLAGLTLYTTVALSIIIFAISRGWYGVNKKQGIMLVFIPTFTISIILFCIILFRSPYAFNRIASVLNPEQDTLGVGYLQILIRDILSQSVMFGKGNAINVTETLPNISTDFSLVYLIHEFGFIILFAIILPLFTFSILGIGKSMQEKSLLGGIVSLTIILTFVIQAFFYISSSFGYALFFTFSLPFISYGNISFIINSALIGFMLSVFRTGSVFLDVSKEDLMALTSIS